MCSKMRVNDFTWNTGTLVWNTPASNGRGENSVRAMKEMKKCQKDVVCTLGVAFSVKTSTLRDVGASQLNGS